MPPWMATKVGEWYYFGTKIQLFVFFLNREFDAFYSKILVENSCIRKLVFFLFLEITIPVLTEEMLDLGSKFRANM